MNLPLKTKLQVWWKLNGYQTNWCQPKNTGMKIYKGTNIARIDHLSQNQHWWHSIFSNVGEPPIGTDIEKNNTYYNVWKTTQKNNETYKD